MATYVVWYLLAALLLGLGVVLWVMLHRKQPPSSDSDLCGDPGVRLSRLAQSARQLAHNLAHFDNWWAAVEDEGFDGRLPDGRRTTHAEAMQTLLFMFAQFFSATWTYQDHCRRHRHRSEVIGWVNEVYRALGDGPGGPTDASIMSNQLHAVGVRSTTGWGTVRARPVQFAEFKVEMIGNPQFIEDLKPLTKLLRTAGPATEARTRLEATEGAVRRVEEKLGKKGHRP